MKRGNKAGKDAWAGAADAPVGLAGGHEAAKHLFTKIPSARTAGAGSGRAQSDLQQERFADAGDSIKPAPFMASAPLDARSLLGALVLGVLFFALGVFSLSLLRFDTALASVWLPNAAAVAFLLRTRLANEIIVYPIVFAASVCANWTCGNALEIALVYSFANMVNIAVVIWLTRTTCGPAPDFTQLSALARFVMAGGLIGPIMSASIAAVAMGPDNAAIWNGATNWFLTDSMGMVIIVPVVLLLCDAWTVRAPPSPHALAERSALLSATILSACLVFSQNVYPLLFLIPPLTLLHAFRLGSVGTAVHLALVAGVAIVMTWAGEGPIAAASASPAVQMHLIQAFIAANFLTGLPFAAILAGRDRVVAELEAGKKRLDLLAYNISDAVLRFNLEGVCTYASPSVEEVLGEPPSAFVGTRLIERTREDARERLLMAEKRLLSGESQRERFTYRRFIDSDQGLPVFIEAECVVETNPRSGCDEGIVISARDVTERVELELLLTRARRQAERAAKAKSEFLANMSHEIRTPMNGVLGFAELILQGDLEPDQRRHTEMIVESGRSMMLLLNDILDLSKIEAGQISIDHTPVDLHATLDECLALHRPMAKKKGLKVTLENDRLSELDGEASDAAKEEAAVLPTVLTDGLRLRQIVLNLIGNAIKFTESGTVRIAYFVSEDSTTIRVEDTGIGISAARLETIFLPFTQEESSTARRFGGTGLGLSISRQLAELLGGVLDVESEPGVGSTFTLTLPTSRVDPLLAAKREPVDLDELDMPQGSRILLAEDHDVNRLLAVEMLKRCGQSVAIAHDGNEAISMVIDGIVRERPFDLVLMDVQMPGCDGYSATRAIREEGISPDDLPIIALTANAFPEDVAAARAAGMQAHLAKPLNFAALARALQRWLPTHIVEAPMDPKLEAAGWGASARSEQLGAGLEQSPLRTEARSEATKTLIDPSDGRPSEETDRTSSANAIAHMSPIRSPALIGRWFQRRSETIEAVREALETGALSQATAKRGEGNDTLEQRHHLARRIHKLAGTAAIFGETELGEQAARLEHALKEEHGGETAERLALELLSIAEEASEDLAEAAEARR